MPRIVGKTRLKVFAARNPDKCSTNCWSYGRDFMGQKGGTAIPHPYYTSLQPYRFIECSGLGTRLWFPSWGGYIFAQAYGRSSVGLQGSCPR